MRGLSMMQYMRFLIVLATASLTAWAGSASKAGAGNRNETPINIILFGDQLTATPDLEERETFARQLERTAKRFNKNAVVQNFSSPGDTTTSALERVDQVIAAKPDIVIVALGLNDPYRGIQPEVTRHALEQIVGKLKASYIYVMVAAIKAPPNIPDQWVIPFEQAYRQVATRQEAVYYPDLLEGVRGHKYRAQPDGYTPTQSGARLMARNMKKIIGQMIENIEARNMKMRMP